MKKKIAIGVASFFLILVFWVQWNWKHLSAFPAIISSFYSKEFCSCYYVMKQSEEQCHNFARQWVPISLFNLDQTNKEVTVSGLGRTNKAKYLGERLGCRLVND
ncbi:hypothetical protein [Leptospira ilyithenensis]|uniref:Amidase n=1 Tax=Leptospira ilyithenensis TaxID=2484901 RepID=A0A4R9LN25_9LEPT|nr:hypothetical protein [Leptospira ilyithenensis]TGN06842.1 hypothetical protein EHS11_16955 [Leptospira ilyithenensis]